MEESIKRLRKCLKEAMRSPDHMENIILKLYLYELQNNRGLTEVKALKTFIDTIPYELLGRLFYESPQLAGVLTYFIHQHNEDETYHKRFKDPEDDFYQHCKGIWDRLDQIPKLEITEEGTHAIKSIFQIQAGLDSFGLTLEDICETSTYEEHFRFLEFIIDEHGMYITGEGSISQDRPITMEFEQYVNGAFEMTPLASRRHSGYFNNIEFLIDPFED